ncbi:hypothetical protein, partial [Bacteroides heparinolyticus]|uniref:hypothetical protein n=1 Tax=Prevotella heparinolytica TaxID=28113 RepID=UPI0035A0839E
PVAYYPGHSSKKGESKQANNQYPHEFPFSLNIFFVINGQRYILFCIRQNNDFAENRTNQRGGNHLSLHTLPSVSPHGIARKPTL